METAHTTAAFGASSSKRPYAENEDGEKARFCEKKPIDARHEIRLLTIYPGELSGPIHCGLAHHRIRDADYDALSYTWGDHALNKEILCDGFLLKVTANCYSALLALRQSGQRRPIWIDAICINQSDIEERNAQVSLMGEIFRLAKETLIYLGDVEPDDETARLFRPNVKGHRFRHLFDLYDPEEVALGLLLSQGHAVCRPQFLARPWFQRTWIIQEVMLSKALSVIIGTGLRLPWLAVEAAFTHWRSRNLMPQMPFIVKMRIELGREYGARTSYGATQRVYGVAPGIGSAPKRAVTLNFWRLLEIMTSTREFKCRDPRDRLYAILPLFSPPAPQLLRPDYSKSARQVYTDLSWYLLDYDTSEALSLAGIAQSSSEFPSWVTNWTHKQHLAPLTAWQYSRPWRAGFALGNRRIWCRRDRYALTLRGRVVDRIAFPAIGSSLRYIFRYDMVNFEKTYPMENAGLILRPGETTLGHEVEDYINVVAKFGQGRQTFLTENGVEGLGVNSVREGDCISVFFGFRLPFVIRRIQHGWILVGECHIDELLEGQAVHGVDWSAAYNEIAQRPFEDFVIY